MGEDRAHDLLRQTWDQKWDTMDSYWFQQHKHISPSEKKQELPQEYVARFYQTTNEFNALVQTIGTNVQGGTPQGRPITQGSIPI